jgi:chitinase
MKNKKRIVTYTTILKLVLSLIMVVSYLSAIVAKPPIKQKKKLLVIGYIGGYRGLINVDMIQPKKLTHLNYAFVNVIGNRAVLNNERNDTVNLRKLYQLKEINPSLKILISIGGWSWSGNFSDAALSDTSRANFASSAVDIVRKYNLDGIDIDWEYPGLTGAGNINRPEDTHNFTLLLQSLRIGLDSLQQQKTTKMYLTVAAGGFSSFLKHTEMGIAEKYLDYVNVMTYDYFAGNLTGHQTNLYTSKKYHSQNSADMAVNSFIAAGVPAGKLLMGLAFYGRLFQVVNNSQKGIGDTVVSHLRGVGYSLIRDSIIGKTTFVNFKDRHAKAPYLFNKITDQFITYDDEWSVKNKCLYVRKKRMAGVMFWEYDTDPKGYLLNEVTEILN